ncbi:hypothetical protein BT69DRAFT_1284913 [Atractiella rhizophila]|nr:hypothetical protein BT69DRAFT_1284913 [Atractiella rhizophila]
MDLDQTPPIASFLNFTTRPACAIRPCAVKQVHTVHATTSPPTPAGLSKRSTLVPMAKATDSSPKN